MNLLKKIGLFVVFGILCLSIASIDAVSVQAAEKTGDGVYSLNTSEGDSFSKVDLTGNGKKDTIDTIVKGKKLFLKLNGEKIKSWNSGSITIQVIKLSSKKAYIEITSENFKTSKTSGDLYQIKKGKLEKVLDYEKLINKKLLLKNDFITNPGCLDMLSASKVKNKTIYLDVRLGTKSLGYMWIGNIQLQYSGGEFNLKKTAGKVIRTNIFTDKGITEYFTASQKIQTYKAADSSKKGITLPKNTKFAAKKVSIIGKEIFVQVKTKSGKTGWIKLSDSDKPFVKECSIVIWG